MRTKRLNESVQLNFGGGTEAYFEYECPCKQGVIIEQHCTIPGEYEHDVTIVCEKCKQEYELDISKGVSNWELIKR